MLAKNDGGAIANMNSVASFVGFATLVTYRASKAATHSVTQVTRAKAPPADAARAIVAGIIAGDDEISPPLPDDSRRVFHASHIC